MSIGIEKNRWNKTGKDWSFIIAGKDRSKYQKKVTNGGVPFFLPGKYVKEGQPIGEYYEAHLWDFGKGNQLVSATLADINHQKTRHDKRLIYAPANGYLEYDIPCLKHSLENPSKKKSLTLSIKKEPVVFNKRSFVNETLKKRFTRKKTGLQFEYMEGFYPICKSKTISFNEIGKQIKIQIFNGSLYLSVFLDKKSRWKDISLKIYSDEDTSLIKESFRTRDRDTFVAFELSMSQLAMVVATKSEVYLTSKSDPDSYHLKLSDPLYSEIYNDLKSDKRALSLLKTEAETGSSTANLVCSVYLMKNLKNGNVKIGISENPRYREKTLNSEEPDIELLTSKLFNSREDALKIEKMLHLQFSEYRVRGEWFSLDPEDVLLITRLLV